MPGAPARAQLTTPILTPVIPFNYGRGRNISVTDRLRPEYDATGIRVGSFLAYPQLKLGAGFTDNAFGTDLDKRSSAIVAVDPSVSVQSDWNRNSLRIDAVGALRRYTAEPIRNQNGWSVTAASQTDLGSDTQVVVNAGTGLQYETRFSGATPLDVASAVAYHSTYGRLRVIETRGRVRAIVAGGAARLRFGDITTLDRRVLDQSYRDRDTINGSLQLEYALTPDVSVFTQGSVERSDYGDSFVGTASDRTSSQVRGLAGLSIDLTDLLRGSFGVGYSRRNYRSSAYNTIAGFSAEARFEYFPTPLTTVTLAARRSIEDATLLGASGYFNTGAGVRVDHELLRNLILNLGADYEVDDYRGIDSRARIVQARGGARYFMTRTVGLEGSLGFGRRRSLGVPNGPTFSETSLLVSLVFRR